MWCQSAQWVLRPPVWNSMFFGGTGKRQDKMWAKMQWWNLSPASFLSDLSELGLGLILRNLPAAAAAAAAAKSLQSCPTLCDPIDGSPPGSPVPGILQARTREWVAISFSNAWKWKVKGKLLSHVRLLATPWTTAYQAPPSMGFSKQEYWSGVPLPSPRNLPTVRQSKQWWCVLLLCIVDG